MKAKLLILGVVISVSSLSNLVASQAQQLQRATVDKAPVGFSPLANSYAIALLPDDDYRHVVTGIEETQGEYEWPRMDSRHSQGWTPKDVAFVICSRGYGNRVSVYYAIAAKHPFDLFPQKSQQAFFENTPLAIASKARQEQVTLSDEGAQVLASMPEPARTRLKTRVNFKIPKSFISWMRTHKYVIMGVFALVIGGIFAYKWNQGKKLIAMRQKM